LGPLRHLEYDLIPYWAREAHVPTDPCLDESRLQEQLLTRSTQLRNYLAAKIPHKLQNEIAAEDILQEVWIEAFCRVSTFRAEGPDSLDRWLCTIGQHVLVNAIKRAATARRGGNRRLIHDRTTQFNSLFREMVSPSGTPSSEAATAEAVDAMQVALASLPDARRQAIWMHFIEGRSRKTIADEMGKTEPAVNSLLFNGLRDLRERLGSLTRFISGDQALRKMRK
jgi:RNA polymerase sigma factor (sigma-70 family)